MTSPGEEIAREMRRQKGKHTANETEVRELQLYVENDGDIYRQRLVPIYKNLIRKKQKKMYKHTLAVKLMKYAVDEGNRKYKKEYGYSFTPSVRYKVASNMVKHFENEYKIGNRW